MGRSAEYPVTEHLGAPWAARQARPQNGVYGDFDDLGRHGVEHHVEARADQGKKEAQAAAQVAENQVGFLRRDSLNDVSIWVHSLL